MKLSQSDDRRRRRRERNEARSGLVEVLSDRAREQVFDFVVARAAAVRGRQVHTEAAAKGRELIEAPPDQPYLYFNTACCESLAGQTTNAIEHLRRAIEMWDGCREMARRDSDLDAIRDDPEFQALVG